MITPDVEQYLKASRIPLRLACITPGNWPVVLSLWFEYRQGNLYCASREQAKVISYLKQNDRCAFEIAGDQPPYCGVRGQGIATLDHSRGAEILERLLTKTLSWKSRQPIGAKATVKTPERGGYCHRAGQSVYMELHPTHERLS